MAIEVDAPRLNELYAGLSGTVQGQLDVRLQPQLGVRADLIGKGVGYNDRFYANHARLVGTLPTGEQPSQFIADLSGVQVSDRRFEQAQVTMQGSRSAHVVKVAARQNKDLRFFTQFAGGLTQQNDWLGQLQQGKLTSRYAQIRQNQPATLIYRQAAQRLIIGKHCWLSQANQRGEICLSQPLIASRPQGAVSLTMRDIELADFDALMPDGFSMQGRLNGYSHVVWQNSQPMHVETVMTTQNGKIILAGDADTGMPPSVLDYRQIRLTADTLAQGLSLRLNANTTQLGTAFADVLVGKEPQHKSLTGTVALDQIKLNVLRPFIRDTRILEGFISAAGRVSGTIQQPQFVGEVRVRDGQFALSSVPVNLTNIQLSSSINGSQALIRGGFNSGQGVGQVSGTADWANDTRIRLSFTGKDLLVAQPPTISASITPKIELDIRPSLKQLTANGRVEIPRAVILMPQNNANVVALSPDVRVVRDGSDPLMMIKTSKNWDIRSNIAIDLGNAVVFRGFNSTVPLAGKINLTQRNGMRMQATGAIGASRQVKIEAYGQSLDLTRAIARFGGDLSNPVLDGDASKTIQGNRVGVRVTGNASRPLINIYNDAGLNEQEALNALLTGRISNNSSGLTNTEGFKSDVNNTIAAAGLSMGLGGTRALTNSIGRSFGLSGLTLDAQGSGNDTQVSVTGYITPDLYLRYGVGIFTPVTKLTLRYQVNRRMYVEASSSVERAVDLFYNWRF